MCSISGSLFTIPQYLNNKICGFNFAVYLFSGLLQMVDEMTSPVGI